MVEDLGPILDEHQYPHPARGLAWLLFTFGGLLAFALLCRPQVNRDSMIVGGLAVALLAAGYAWRRRFGALVLTIHRDGVRYQRRAFRFGDVASHERTHNYLVIRLRTTPEPVVLRVSFWGYELLGQLAHALDVSTAFSA